MTPLGGGRFKLHRLLRGRLGTELAVSTHAAGETFCVLDPGALQSIDLPVATIGKEVTVIAPGGYSESLVVRARADGITAPSGGTNVDAEARTSIGQILATLRQHGLIES